MPLVRHCARALLVVLCGILSFFILSQPELLGSSLSGNSADRLSRKILHGQDSPFHQLALNLDEDVRTDLQVRTPATPFGIGLAQTLLYKVRAGESLRAIWQKFGASSYGSNAAADAFEEAGVPLKGLKAGDELTLKFNLGDIVGLEKRLSDGSKIILTGDSEEGYKPEVRKVVVEHRERVVTGVVNSSLSASADEMDVPYSLVDDFVDLFGDRVEFSKDLQPGDTFSLIYDERWTDDGELLGTGEIIGASIKLGDKMYAAVRDVAPDGTVNYFNEKGELPGKGFLRYPLKFTKISSMFSNARFHPVLQVSRPHHGVDFAASTGTPVRTIGNGTVIFAGFKSSTGNMVRIKHDAQYTTEYMHLSRITKGLRVGSVVNRGDVIGGVGQTGLATGPHLHFGLFKAGVYVDPLKTKLQIMPERRAPPVQVMAKLEVLKKNHEAIFVAAIPNKKPAA